MAESRLRERRTRIWRREYLLNRRLWANIRWAVEKARLEIATAAPLVLDLGCGRRPYEDLFMGCRYESLDVTRTDASPDVVGDVTHLPVRDSAVDLVFSSQVIEHVLDPQAMVRECRGVLNPRGCLVLTGPQYWPLHEEPHDFHRFTKYGLDLLLRGAGFAGWEIRADGGDWAQAFLSLNLGLRAKWTAPLRAALNLLGLALDRLDHHESSPANHTVLART